MAAIWAFSKQCEIRGSFQLKHFPLSGLLVFQCPFSHLSLHVEPSETSCRREGPPLFHSHWWKMPFLFTSWWYMAHQVEQGSTNTDLAHCVSSPLHPPYFAHLLPVITPCLNAKNTIKNRSIWAGELTKFLAGLSLEKYEDKLREYGVEVVFLC